MQNTQIQSTSLGQSIQHSSTLSAPERFVRTTCSLLSASTSSMRLISSMVLFKMDSSTPFSRASSLRSCVAMHKDCRLAAVSTRGTAVPRLATTQPRQCQERRAGAHFCHLEKLTAACHCVPCAAFAGGDGAMLTMQRRARQQPLALHPAHGLVSGELCSDTRHIVDHRACAALCVHLRRLRSDPRANRAAMSLLSLGECKSFACGVVAREPSKSRRWLSRGEAASEAEACRGVVPPESTDVEETAFAQPAPGSRGGETSMPGAGAGREKGSGRERERAREGEKSVCPRACACVRVACSASTTAGGGRGFPLLQLLFFFLVPGVSA